MMQRIRLREPWTNLFASFLGGYDLHWMGGNLSRAWCVPSSFDRAGIGLLQLVLLLVTLHFRPVKSKPCNHQQCLCSRVLREQISRDGWQVKCDIGQGVVELVQVLADACQNMRLVRQGHGPPDPLG